MAKRWDAAVFPRVFSRRGGALPRADDSARFFFLPSDVPSITTYLRQRLPDAVENTLTRAEAICRHRFSLLGYDGIQYGDRIDWHLDPVSGKQAPRKPFFKIQYLDFNEVGDAKVTWELNRHQHLVTLAKAHCFTREDRFVKELLGQWYDWQEQNPYPIGVNWASSLEVAFRCLSWIWVRYLLADCPLADSRFQSDLQHALLLGGRHIERYLSTYFSPNTHLLGEAVALFFLGLLCGESAATRRWKSRGWQMILQEAERQVLADGMHFEQATYYHVYALDFFLHARILAARNGIPIPPEFDQALERMLQAVALLGRAGPPPRFGDDDGGRLFDPRRNRTEHLLDPLATGLALFRRHDWKTPQLDLVEETVWVLGVEGAKSFDAVPPQRLPAESAALESSGVYLLIHPGPPVCRLSMDAGPQGACGAGHGHADALSLQLSVGGSDLLTDPGTFVYASGGSERGYFRGTAAHNTLQVDHADQAEATGPFPWRRLPDVRREHWIQGDRFDLLVVSHNGYQRLSSPVIHRRWVLGLKASFWFVLDVAEGQGVHHLDLFWHLAPGCHWQLEANSAIGVGEKGSVALVFPKEAASVPAPFESCYSPVYGNRISSQSLVFSREERLPSAFATILQPMAQPRDPVGLLTTVQQRSPDCGFHAYRYDCGDESHFIFLSYPHQRWQWSELSSDADILYCGITRGGGERLFFCGGTYVMLEGRQMIACSRPVSRLEWAASAGQEIVSCSDQSAIVTLAGKRLKHLERWVTEATAP